ncbi:MAG: universal stress protein, partial [Candidatus Limnocylindrales bacterium]
MSAKGGLPERILLPLANPRTAADLVKIGAAIMAHGGTLTALGIVEVPEGMPLSEGATRARQARRLLQRVLEFAPDDIELRTTVRIGRRAAEGIVEAATEEEADLIV